jgi:SAM-dependent methyltransferase
LSAPRVFDLQHYDLLNRARGDVVSQLIAELKPKLNLQTAIDVGCGLGYFSGFLKSHGLDVMGVDGRYQNVEEARRRNPGIRFHQYNAEDQSLTELGKFDLVFCFGLLYHLENPFLAIRNLLTITGRILLIESVIFPGEEPIMGLIDESEHEDQGLNHVAFYPSEACLIKILYRVGLPCVYSLAQQPNHPEYYQNPGSRRVRTMLVASTDALDSRKLSIVQEPSSKVWPWDPKSGVAAENSFQKLRRFAEKPLPEKVKSIRRIIKAK